MISRRSGATALRTRAATVLWPIVVWCAASIADPPQPPPEDHSRDSAGPAGVTECDKSGEGAAQEFENSGLTRSHPVLTETSFTAWQKYIQADDAEQAWKQIPWLLTFGEGIAKADAEGKPLLLWVMNGHPLGCT